MSSRVARLNAGRTNQKLYFTRLTLQQLPQLTEESERLAALEAAIFHLHGAYLAFLQELARFYKLSPSLGSTQAIRAALAERSQVSPEVSQMEQLQEGQWLGQLQQAFADCQLAPEPPEPQPEAELPEGFIARSAMPQESLMPEPEHVQAWLQALQNLIRDFRREMAEW